MAQLPPCVESVANTEDWRLIEDHAFEFRLPPEYSEVKVQPEDSHVRHFVTTDSQRRFGFDYGNWSSTLDEYRAHPEFAECRAEIGGRTARVVTALTPWGYAAAATWRDLRPGVHLSMSGAAPDRAGQMEAVVALRTVRFLLP